MTGDDVDKAGRLLWRHVARECLSRNFKNMAVWLDEIANEAMLIPLRNPPPKPAAESTAQMALAIDLLELIDGLPDLKQQRLAWLVIVRGLTVEEAAVKLRITVHNANTRMRGINRYLAAVNRETEKRFGRKGGAA